MRRLLLLLLVCGCGARFPPASDVSDRVRLLAVKAEPPELDPTGAVAASSATLSSLVTDVPELTDPARSVWVFHLACTPDPANPFKNPCTSFQNLTEPSTLLAAIGSAGCPAATSAAGCVSFVGAEHCTQSGGCVAASVAGLPSPPVYSVPAGFAWPGGFAEVVVVSLVVATDQDLTAADPAALQAELAKAFQDDPTQENHVLAVKRIEIRGARAPADAPNVNPQVLGILASGAPLTTLDAQATVPIVPEACLSSDPSCVKQSYTTLDSDDQPISTQDEEWLYSFFATVGKLDEGRTLGEVQSDTWFGPTSPEGKKQPLAAPIHSADSFYVVVRDRRGGINWAVVPVTVQ